MTDIVKELREWAADIRKSLATETLGAGWNDGQQCLDRAAGEIESLRATLKNIATQKTIGELSEEGEDCEGDFEGAYDALIHIARRAIEATP